MRSMVLTLFFPLALDLQELGALNVQYLLTLENCATPNLIPMQKMEDYVWQEIIEPVNQKFLESVSC